MTRPVLDIRVVSAIHVDGREIYHETEIDGERVRVFTGQYPEVIQLCHDVALKPHYPHITRPVPSARPEQSATPTAAD